MSWHTLRNVGNHIHTPLDFEFLQMLNDEFSVACEGYGDFFYVIKFSFGYLMVIFFGSIYMLDFNVPLIPSFLN